MTTSNQPLLRPYRSAALTLPNRVVMAPLTRARAAPGTLEPGELHALYYAQRASAGLIVSEGVWVSEAAIGWAGVPGIFGSGQVRAWRRVTDAVHAAGGRIVAQLWHAGSISHPDFFGGQAPAAPSAVNPDYHSNTPSGAKPTVAPRAMSREEITRTKDDFVRAAVNAMEAGFDGVQLQAGYVYLFNQFLTPATNQRTDEYGGDVESRARFLFETLEAIGALIGFERIGLKTGPITGETGRFVSTAETIPTSDHVIARLNDYPLAHLLLMAPMSDIGGTPAAELCGEGVFRRYRSIYRGTIIGNVGLDREGANDLIERGLIDLAAFGQQFIANPDLIERFARDAPLARVDWEKCYGGGEQGFTDYPRLGDQPAHHQAPVDVEARLL